jgi:O-methyltransferase involved in polyketide biosynthesis
VTDGSGEPEEIARAEDFDPAKPNAARIYDYLLGGKDNFAADREAAAELVRALPDAGLVARANRAFLAAAVRYVARRGIGQFVDIGAGLPTYPNVHECAREAVPDARVAYVDNDAVVVAHARALMATDHRVTVISKDLRDYEALLSGPGLGAFIDMSKPVCVLFVSMLHFLSTAEADAAVAAFRERMAPGSYLVISAGVLNERSARVGDQIQSAYGEGKTLTGRTEAQFAACFGDFELEPPGIVAVTDWPADTPHPRQQTMLHQVPSAPAKAQMLAGIACKRG